MAQESTERTIKVNVVNVGAEKAEPKTVVWPDIYLHTAQFERMRSLEKAKTLLSGEPSSAGMGFVRSGAPAPAAKDMIRLAHYISTGRDYRDRSELDGTDIKP